jgi:hypothetical protein
VNRILRGPRELRERVDGKLGHGSGMTMLEARDLLSPAERVEWALGECLFSMLDRRFHIWVQGWCLDRGVDGPAAVAAIAEETRSIDAVVADLLRWTSLRGVWARTGERKEALSNVVPEVWLGAWHRVKPYVEAVASRWPDDLDPFAMPAPAPWSRRVVAAAGTPRYPAIRPDWGAEPTIETVVETAAHALWAGGASEDDLDEFNRVASGDRLPDMLAEWVAVDESVLGPLRLALHPPDLLAKELGVSKIVFPSLIVRPPDQEHRLIDAAKQYRTVVLAVTLERGFADAARLALRQDPDLVIARAGDIGPDDVDIMITILETGHVVLLLGEAPGLVDRAKGAGIPLLR